MTYYYKAVCIVLLSLLSISIGKASDVVITIVSVTDETCYNANDGTVTVSVSGGVAPYSTSLFTPVFPQGIETFPGSNVFVFSNVEPSNYFVLAADQDPTTLNGFLSVSVGAAGNILFNGDVTYATCVGSNDGAISLAPTGGNLPFTGFSWDGGQSTQNISGIDGGNYTLTITDNIGCTYDSIMNVGYGINIVADFVLPLDNCQGQSLIFSDASIGSPTSYAWDFGDGASLSSSVLVGPHLVTYSSAGPKSVALTVTQGICSHDTTKMITVFPLPTVTIDPVLPMCIDEEVITLTGSPLLGNFSGTGVTGTTFNPSDAGVGGHVVTYTFTDGNGCEAVANTIITVNALPTVTVNNIDLCTGDAAGTFIAVSSTATSWLWSGNGSGVNQTTTGTAAGNYTVVVTDANTCSSTAESGLLTINALPIVSVNDATICAGDGAVTFTAGGTGTSWLWSGNGSGTDQTTNGTTAGLYTVVVTDGNTCSATASGTLIVNASPTVSVSDAKICLGDAAVTFTAGGTGTSWLWSGNGSGTDQTTSGTSSGLYTVVVTDKNSCSATASGTLTVNALPTVSVNDATICADAPAAIFTADGTGTSWLWSGNGAGIDQTTSGTTAGLYTVVAIDGNNCTNTASGTLTVNVLPTVSVNSETVCADVSAVTFTAGGTGTNWFWSGNGSGTDQTTSGTSAGLYTVVVTDGNSCSSTASGTLTVNALPTVSVNDATICADAPPAIFTAGGTGTSWLWSGNGSGTGQITSGTTAGLYTVVATDGNNCTNTASGTLTINALPIVSVNDATICSGDAAVTFTAGGTGTSWLWSGNGSGTDQTTNGTTAGLYTVVATDGNNCSTIGSGTLSVNLSPTVNVNDATICSGDAAVTFTATGTGTSWLWSVNGSGADQTTSGTSAGLYTVVSTAGNNCATTASGTLTVNALPTVSVNDATICADAPAAIFKVGGTGTSWLWSGNGAGIDQTTSGTTAGLYTVVATDGNNCTNTASGTLTVNVLPTVSVNSETICADAPAAIFTAGGTGTSWLWNGNGSGTDQTTSGTTAGLYTVVATDGNNCTNTASGTLTVNALPTLSVNDATICAGDGAVTFTAGGTGTSWLWSENGSGTDQTTSGITAGLYTVVTTDGNNCSTTAKGTLTVNAKPLLVITDPSPVCSPSTVDITLPSVTSSSTNEWVNSYFSDALGTVSLDSPAASLDGTYYILTTTVDGCRDTASVTVLVNPLPVFSLVEVAPSACGVNDGSITVSGLLGNTTYDIVSDGFSSGVFTTDALGVILMNNLGAGNYTNFVVTSAAGCSSTDPGVTLSDPNSPIVDAGTVPPICLGEEVTLIASNPNNASISWDNNVLDGVGFVPTTIGSTMYAVTADLLGCISTDNVIITVNAKPLLVITDPSPVCSPSTVDITLPSVTSSSTNEGVNSYFSDALGTVSLDSPTASLDGTYYILTTTVDGCRDTASVTVLVNPLPVIVLSPNSAMICQGDTIEVVAQGGDTHSWSPLTNIDDVSFDSPKIYPLETTVYTDTVTSSMGCKATESITIDVMNRPNIVYPVGAIVCENDSIQLTVTSDVGSTFSWSPSASVAEVNNGVTFVSPTTSTTYTVTVLNTDLCADSVEINVSVNELPTGTLLNTGNDTVCSNEDVILTASIDMPSVLSPLGGYSYDNGSSFVGVNMTTVVGDFVGDSVVTLLLKDQFGCVSDTVKTKISVLEEITFTLEELVIPTCENPNEGEFNIRDIQGGVPNYTVTVNGDATTDVTSASIVNYTDLPIAIYNVSILDDFGCAAEKTISFQNSITFDTIISHPQCNGDLTGSITIESVQGGVLPYEFSFEGGAYSDISLFTELGVGVYTILIKDDLSCEIPSVIEIVEPPTLVVSVDNLINESCQGLDDGVISVSALGGNPRYIFNLDGTSITGLEATFNDVVVGVDTIMVQDTLGCLFEVSFEVLEVTPIVSVFSTAIASNCSVNDGSARLEFTIGESRNYLYSLNGATQKDSSSFVQELISLSVGDYTVITTDLVGGCQSSASFTINATGGLVLDSVKQTFTNESCVGNDGVVTLSNFTGTPGDFKFELYDALVDTVLVVYQLDSIFTSLGSNSYYVKIKDGTGCEYPIEAFTIEESSPMVVSVYVSPADCGEANGQISASVLGGVSQYTYVMDSVLTQDNGVFQNLESSTYEITVTDDFALTCTASISVFVWTNTADLTISVDSVICSYSEDGIVTLLNLNNDSLELFDYFVSVDATDEFLAYTDDLTFTGLATGSHSLNIKQVTKSGNDSCVYLDTENYIDIVYEGEFYEQLILSEFFVFAPDTIKIKTIGLSAEKGQNDGAVGIYQLTGGSSDYEFGVDLTVLTSYDNQDSTLNFISDLGEGKYSIIVQDRKGCQGEFIEDVTSSFYIPNIFTPNGDGTNDVFEVKGLPDNSRLRVYDRWGSRVYFTENYTNDWDGGNKPDGTYFFELETENQGTHKGWIQIVR